jgi:hypothetical protein
MSELGNGELFKPDVNSSLLSVKIGVLRLLNISQFLDLQQEFTSNSLAHWFEEISKPIPRSQIKSILGMSINPEKDTAIGVAQRLLGLMGLKMTCLGRFNEKKDSQTQNRQRVYRLLTSEPDGRNAIFERWLDKAMSTPSINNELELGGMVA